MAGKDFYDVDLIGDDRAGRAPAGAEDRLAGTGAAREEESFYQRQKRELPGQVSQTADEIERLHLRQEELEQRKQALVEQRRRVEAFEKGRREMLEKLGRSAVMVVREGEQASRMGALCSETGALFKKLHQELESIHPEQWNQMEYDQSLTQALARIEAAGTDYRRAMDRVNAASWRRSAASENTVPLDPAIQGGATGGLPNSFFKWLMAGLAFSLPLIVILLALLFLFWLNVWRVGG